MKYMGSKNRISKDLVPIIQSYIDNNNIENYLEPFVGGCSIIEKIKCKNRYGSDNHKYLIALLNNLDKLNELPDFITKEHYSDVRNCYNKKLNNYEDWYIGAIGFLASYNGRFFDGGYAGLVKTKIGTERNYYKEAYNNLLSQSNKLKNIVFNCCDFRDIKPIKNFVIYCFDKQTEVLTKDGWKFFKDVDINKDLFLSREPNTKKLDWLKATHYISYHYNGKMYSYNGRQIDICVTEDHNIFGSKLVGRKKEHKEFLMKASDFANNIGEKTFIKSGGIWQGKQMNIFKIGEQEFNAIKFARLLGIFLTDGSVNKKGIITISQSKPKIINQIEILLNDLNFKYSVYNSNRNNGGKIFYLSKKYLEFFQQFYLKKYRKIPKQFKEANIEVIVSLIEGILDGDSDNERRKIIVGSKTLVDDIQECLYKIGKASNYSIKEPKESFLKSENRIIKSKEPYYIISILKTEYPPQVKNNIQWINYNDMVYCITLEKWHTVLTRRNGKTVWMGQCDIPYKNTKQYSNSKNFPYEEFYEWCKKMSKDNIVLISEYDMPKEFECIWSKKIETSMDNNRNANDDKNKRIEKLFIYRGYYLNNKNI